MNYGSEPADQVVRYSLEGAEFALRISGTAAKNFFIFAQAVLHDSKKTHGKTHLIRLLKEQKPLKFFTVASALEEVTPESITPLPHEGGGENAGGAYSNWVIWLENNALWAGCLLIAAVIGCMLIWRRHRKD